MTPDALRFAILRLIKKRRIIRPKHNFYVIVPTEYLNIGMPPIPWFIDSLMKFYEQPYYVGLLSAAALYGAAHQQPQVFQVITNKPIRTINIFQTRIEFITKKNIDLSNCQKIKSPTGYMNVSLPELTALDLVQHIKSSGYLNHVATVLFELQEQLNEDRFIEVVKIEKTNLYVIQRLGYLLENLGIKNKIILFFKKLIKDKKPRIIPLRPDKFYDRSKKNLDWRLYINEDTEVDI